MIKFLSLSFQQCWYIYNSSMYSGQARLLSQNLNDFQTYFLLSHSKVGLWLVVSSCLNVIVTCGLRYHLYVDVVIYSMNIYHILNQYRSQFVYLLLKHILQAVNHVKIVQNIYETSIMQCTFHFIYIIIKNMIVNTSTVQPIHHAVLQ